MLLPWCRQICYWGARILYLVDDDRASVVVDALALVSSSLEVLPPLDQFLPDVDAHGEVELRVHPAVHYPARHQECPDITVQNEIDVLLAHQLLERQEKGLGVLERLVVSVHEVHEEFPDVRAAPNVLGHEVLVDHGPLPPKHARRVRLQVARDTHDHFPCGRRVGLGPAIPDGGGPTHAIRHAFERLIHAVFDHFCFMIAEECGVGSKEKLFSDETTKCSAKFLEGASENIFAVVVSSTRRFVSSLQTYLQHSKLLICCRMEAN